MTPLEGLKIAASLMQYPFLALLVLTGLWVICKLAKYFAQQIWMWLRN